MEDRPSVRQQSSENNSLSSSEWDMANDVFVSVCDDHPPGDGFSAGDREGPQDGHLPLLRGGGSQQLSQECLMLGLTAQAYLDIDQDYTESDGSITTKKRIRSNSSRHRGEIVTELGPEEVRWFYKEDKRTWKPFVGHDSLKIERVYRRLCEQNPEKIKCPVQPAEPDGKEAVLPDETQADSWAVEGADDPVEPAEPAEQRADGQQGPMSEEMKDPGGRVEAVCVRGGLYEVDVREKECYPVYWNRERSAAFPSILTQSSATSGKPVLQIQAMLCLACTHRE